MTGSKKRVSSSDRVFDIAVIIILAVISIVTVYPLYYTLVASFTDPVVVNTGKFLLYPEELFFGGYEEVFEYTLIWRSYLNTIIYTTVGVVISLVITIPLSYALSRKDFVFRRILITLSLITMFFQGGMIPSYINLLEFDMLDTIWAIVLPGAVSVWNMIVCRSFFETTIPIELLEASRIDGCSDFSFLFKIVLPLSTTIICVMALFYGTAMWNSYLPALMYLTETEAMPLQVILRNLLIMNEDMTSYSSISDAAFRQQLADQLKYCVVVVAAAPILAIFPFLQKYFVKGVMVGSVKG